MGAPLNSIFSYVGTWDAGSSSGTLNLAPYMISHDDITDHLISGAESRGWNSQCTVRLDDSSGFLIGTFMKDNDWLDGVFWLRANMNGTWTDLMAGHVPPDAWSQDYGNEYISMTINSMVSKASTAIIPWGNTTVAPIDPTAPWLNYMGTIHSISGSVYSFRTTSDYRDPNLKNWIPNAYTWQDLGSQINTDAQMKLRVDESISGWTLLSTTGTIGTFQSQVSFRTDPDWLAEGEGCYMSMPFPMSNITTNMSEGGIGTIWDIVADKMGLTWNADSRDTFGSALEFIQLSYIEPAINQNSLGTAPQYFGGERWYDVMVDLMSSVGANWSVNSAGEMMAFIRSPNSLPLSGTLDFNDVYNKESGWLSTQSIGAKTITVLSDWDDREGEYIGTSAASGGIASGADVTIKAKWLKGIAGPALAERMMIYNSQYQKRLPFDVEGSRWSEFVPGTEITVTNLPYAISPGCSGGVCILTRFLVASRLYNRDEDIMTLELDYDGDREAFFTLDDSELDGDKQLW